MIRFRCIYCGREISVGQALAGKRIACPACDHFVRVQPKETGAALKSAAGRTGETAPKDADRWQEKTDDDIVVDLLYKTLPKEERRRLAAKRALGPLLPRYNDLTLFAFSVAFLLLLLIDPALRELFVTAFRERVFSDITIYLAVPGVGMVLALVNVFFARDKSDFEKTLLLLFGVVVTAGTGIYAGQVMLRQGPGWLMIFPAWNIANGFLLLILSQFGLVDTDCIVDEKAGLIQILATVVSISLLLALCRYAFELHWAVTFSIAVGYTMSLLGAVQDLFGPRPKRRQRCPWPQGKIKEQK